MVGIQIIAAQIDDLVAIAHSGNKVLVIGSQPENQIFRRQLFLCNCTKTDIIVPEHTDIQIIVPGDESAMPYSPQQSSKVRKPRDLMSVTNFGYVRQDL